MSNNTFLFLFFYYSYTYHYLYLIFSAVHPSYSYSTVNPSSSYSTVHLSSSYSTVYPSSSYSTVNPFSCPNRNRYWDGRSLKKCSSTGSPTGTLLHTSFLFSCWPSLFFLPLTWHIFCLIFSSFLPGLLSRWFHSNIWKVFGKSSARLYCRFW